MRNRKTIEVALAKLGLTATSMDYRNCRSSWTYGDSSPSGEWTVCMEDGSVYISGIDYDSVSQAVDAMIKEIEFDVAEQKK